VFTFVVDVTKKQEVYAIAKCVVQEVGHVVSFPLCFTTISLSYAQRLDTHTILTTLTRRKYW